MKKPDPENSKIRDIFDRNFPYESVEMKWADNGQPLFEETDPITTSTGWLDMLVHKLIVEDKITQEAFAELYRLYGTREKGFHIEQANNNKSNTIKSLRNGHISAKKFSEVLRILGYDIDSLQIVLIKNGKKRIVSVAYDNGGLQE